MKIIIATLIALTSFNVNTSSEVAHLQNSVSMSTTIVSEGNVVFNNVDQPYTLEYIKSTFSANDEIEGDLSSEIYILLDNYSGNETTFGDYMLVFGVKDSKDQETTMSIIIRNVDINDPYFEVEVESSLNIPQFSILSANLPKIKAYDLHDGDITSEVSILGLTNIDTGVLGSHDLTYTVSDEFGNEISQVFTVHVVDSTQPVIEGVSEIVKRANVILDGQFYLEYLSATDDQDGIITNKLKVTSDEYMGNANKPGTYKVVVTAEDLQGNYINHTITIKVVKSMIPNLIIDKYYWVVPNNHKYVDSEFISTLKSINDLPNNEYIFTTTYDNYSNFYDSEGTYSKTFELLSSTGSEFEKEIILEVVSSDLNIVEEAPSWWSQNGKIIMGITIIGCLFILVGYGIVKS